MEMETDSVSRMLDSLWDTKMIDKCRNQVTVTDKLGFSFILISLFQG